MKHARFFCGPDDTLSLEAIGWNKEPASAFTHYTGRCGMPVK
jgi:hypothetical protein